MGDLVLEVVVVAATNVDVVVGEPGETSATAADASRRPVPDASSRPGASMSVAPCWSAARSDAGDRPGARSSIRAATPAEWGAAADVPKKRQDGGHPGKPPAF